MKKNQEKQISSASLDALEENLMEQQVNTLTPMQEDVFEEENFDDSNKNLLDYQRPGTNRGGNDSIQTYVIRGKHRI